MAYVECDRCRDGAVPAVYSDEPPYVLEWTDCPECGGHGVVDDDRTDVRTDAYANTSKGPVT